MVCGILVRPPFLALPFVAPTNPLCHPPHRAGSSDGTLRRSLSSRWEHMRGSRSGRQVGGASKAPSFAFSSLLSKRSKLILAAVAHHRTKFRKQANAADNRAATMSVDSLINYEAVKVRLLLSPFVLTAHLLLILSTSTTKPSKSLNTIAP
jgi:hypothetical protein